MVAAQAGAGNAPSRELKVSRSSVRLEVGDIPAADRARGRVFTGLMPTSSCPQAWTVIGTRGLCTHGPDSAPAGVDVTRARSTASLVATTDEGTASVSSGTGSVPCYGDGVSGKRVQVVYAHAADVPDRFNDLASSLVYWMGRADKVFNDSAAETGGIRHVRWVTDSGCNLVIQRVQLSTTGDDTYGNTVSELQSVGLTRSDRKYVILVDANIYCGISSLYHDDSASLSNINNGGPGYARIDNGCWGQGNSIEAHELMHLLGGVQYTAPHTSGGGHCTDDYDRMCYADSSSVTMTYPCSDYSHERLFDCNHDDYFSTNPPGGSYLATHWNTASSSFLEPVVPDGWSPSTTTTTTSSPTPTPSPTQSASSTTTTLSGTLSRKISSRTYSIATGSGGLSVSLTFSKASKLTLAVTASGSTVASQSGPSPEALTSSVTAGTYSVVVSGSGSATFTLNATYPNP